jgi:RNA polymerase sigma-70 factor (ECF subfamily)
MHLEDPIVEEILNVTGDDPQAVVRILSGSGTDGSLLAPEDAGGMFEGCRQYLLMVANEVIGPALRAKLGASDLVQDTFLEAQRHLGVFRGRTKAELRGWLRKILECRMANIRRSYLGTEKRATQKEVTIDTLLTEAGGNGEALASRSPSPSSHVLRSEWAATLEQALQRLPDHYRQAVAWRHHEHLPWDEIGRRMDCTADAARKVWSRAIQQLRRELVEHGSMP